MFKDFMHRFSGNRHPVAAGARPGTKPAVPSATRGGAARVQPVVRAQPAAQGQVRVQPPVRAPHPVATADARAVRPPRSPVPPAQRDAAKGAGTALVPAAADTARVQRRVAATDGQVEGFLAFTGDVLTAEEGDLSAADRLARSAVAFLGDGTLLVHKANPISPESMEVRDAVRRLGRHVVQEFTVELDVIRRVHEAAMRRKGGVRSRGRAGETLQKMQHEVLGLINEAVRRKASDIHITVGRYEAQQRMRLDGVMESVRQSPSDWASDLCAAAFNMADASDPSYRPYEFQGARISEINTPLPEGVQSLRLQFNPLPNGGRYLVARLLYASSNVDVGGDVDTLGYSRVHIEQIRRMRRKTEGINVISGPTGSGKSTTLHRALIALMHEKRNQINVVTVEDPVEFIIPGAVQLNVVNASGDDERAAKFQAAINAALRDDPDVIMIGEIRDQPSSHLAFAAAMTGHQVWASLHANNAMSILDRFRDQKVEMYKLGDPTLVTGLIGQRLIRRLCPKCRLTLGDARARNLVARDVLHDIDRICEAVPNPGVHFANPDPVGCTCRGGYTGREVVAETIVPDQDFMVSVRAGDKAAGHRYWLDKLDGLTMLEHGAQKMIRGLCDPRDVEDKVGELCGVGDGRFKRIFGELFDDAQAGCGQG
jgi:type II secretory ATPase GspE/PulE/Tfp pilus assembly ATPase PilB-like protein